MKSQIIIPTLLLLLSNTMGVAAGGLSEFSSCNDKGDVHNDMSRRITMTACIAIKQQTDCKDCTTVEYGGVWFCESKTRRLDADRFGPLCVKYGGVAKGSG